MRSLDALVDVEAEELLLVAEQHPAVDDRDGGPGVLAARDDVDLAELLVRLEAGLAHREPAVVVEDVELVVREDEGPEAELGGLAAAPDERALVLERVHHDELLAVGAGRLRVHRE